MSTRWLRGPVWSPACSGRKGGTQIVHHPNRTQFPNDIDPEKRSVLVYLPRPRETSRCTNTLTCTFLFSPLSRERLLVQRAALESQAQRLVQHLKCVAPQKLDEKGEAAELC
mmetsp:Transcript_74982/g.124907  ORF Transcript_74982/g.124907 Transcript_74982/m.124907 type:complete len:112 (+) Transcript_74982:425-760(+)